MPSTEIVALEAVELDLPLSHTFVIATGRQPQAHNVLVRVRLSDATVGLGEAAPVQHISGETRESTLAAIERARDLVLGQDARAWRALAVALAEVEPEAAAARCAIETAVLDAVGRHFSMPLWSFWGGATTELRTDITVVAGTVEEAAAQAAEFAQQGYATLKVKVGAADPDTDLRRMLAIHETTPDARLVVDANGGYDLAAAVAFVDGLRGLDVPLALFEQPLPRGESDAWVELASSTSVPLCADESARNAREVLELAVAGAIGAVNVKPMKSGVAEAVAMWQAARTANLTLMCGGMVESIVAMSASAALAAGLGGFAFVDLDTPPIITAHPFAGGYRQSGDRLVLSGITQGHGAILAPGRDPFDTAG